MTRRPRRVLTLAAACLLAGAAAATGPAALAGPAGHTTPAGHTGPATTSSQVGPAARSAKVIHIRLTKAIDQFPVAKHTHAARYDREKQFGDWVTQYGECDTRAVVLMTESLKPVTKNQNCTVSKGKWYSYYDGKYYLNAYGGKVQIDHTVPVYNAWVTGAWRWTKATRVRYYNDLRDPRTLVAVDAHDNEVKGGDDPTGWMPSHGKCRYVRYWTAVKTRWHLHVTAPEKKKLATVAAGCRNVKITVTKAVVKLR